MKSDPIDTMQPWTIKSIATSDRDFVVESARKDGVTVGQWIGKRLADWRQDGHPVSVQVSNHGLGDLVSMTIALAEVAPESLRERMVRYAWSRVRDEIRASRRGLPVLETQSDHPKMLEG